MFGMFNEIFDEYSEVRRKSCRDRAFEVKQDTREVGAKNRGERVDM